MARSIQDIQQQLIDKLQSSGIIVSANKASRRRIWTYAVAYCIYVLETLQDVLRLELRKVLDEQKPGSRRWYAWIGTQFQYGSSVNPDTAKYDNTGLTNQQIEDQKIIKQCSSSLQDGVIVIKAVKGSNGVYSKLNNDEAAALNMYYDEVSYAGVDFTIRVAEADKIKMVVEVKRNPQIINESGARIDGTNNAPIKQAVLNYLNNIGFDGKFVKSKCFDEIQAIEGVDDLAIRLVQVSQAGTNVWVNVDLNHQPFSGWFAFENSSDLLINFI